MDDEREVSDRPSYTRRPKYKAEMEADLDPLPYYEEDEAPPRRIPGSRDSRSSRDDYYDDEAPRRIERRSSSERSNTDKPRRRSNSRPIRTPERFDDNDWETSSKPAVDDWDNSSSEEKDLPGAVPTDPFDQQRQKTMFHPDPEGVVPQ